MVVNIFGLVVAIELNEHDTRLFSDFIYVFVFGAMIALLAALLWPEDTASDMEAQLLTLLEDL